MTGVPAELEARISRARAEKRRSLDLRLSASKSNLARLEHIPAEVFDLADLESLNISGHAITDIPPEIAKLRKLRSLDLSDNLLTDLPMPLFTLQAMEELFLQRNRLVVLDSAVTRLKNLKVLCL